MRPWMALGTALIVLGTTVGEARAQGGKLIETGVKTLVPSVRSTSTGLAELSSVLGSRGIRLVQPLETLESTRLSVPIASSTRLRPIDEIIEPGACDVFDATCSSLASQIDEAARLARLEAGRAWLTDLKLATEGGKPIPVVEQTVTLTDGSRATQVTAVVEYGGWKYSIRQDAGMKTPITVLAAPGEMNVTDGVAQIPGFREIPADEFFAAVREGRPIDVNNPAYKRPKLIFNVSRIGGEDGVSLEIMHWARGYLRSGGRAMVITGERTASAELVELEKLGLEVEVIPEASPSLAEAQAEYDALYGPVGYRQEHGREFWEGRDPTDASAALAQVEQRAKVIREKSESILRNQEGYWVLDIENMGLGWKQNANAVAAGDVMERMRPPVAGRIHDLPDDRPEYAWSLVPQPIKDRLNILRQYPNNVFSVINGFDEARMATRQMRGVRLVPNANDMLDPRLSVRPSSDELKAWRKALLGDGADDTFIAMWPVRPVARKRGDVGIRLIQKVIDQNPGRKVAVVVSHSAKDASAGELQTLRSLADEAGVELVFAEEKLAAAELEVDPLKLHHLGDVHIYPSDFEGWGNAANEAWQVGASTPLAEGVEPGGYGTVVVMNRYSVFEKNIEPLGIRTPTFKIPESFKFTDSQTEGLSVFERDELAGLDAELDEAAGTINAVLDNRGTPGAPLSGEWAEMANHNYGVLAENTDYPVITDIVTGMMWDAASAANRYPAAEGVRYVKEVP